MHPARRLLLALAAPLALAATAAPRDAHAQANVMGQWSSLFFTGEQATDCAVLRGRGDTTVVLYSDAATSARVLLPDTGPPASWPMVRVPHAGHALHEGGHAMLPDGRYAVFGGSAGIRFNSPHTATFDARFYSNPVTRGWAADDDMAFRRISSNALPMPDGSVLVQSGVDHYSLPMFGGETASGVTGELRELASRASPEVHWAQRPNPGGPSAREGARAAFGFRQFTLFGGRDAAGAHADVWRYERRQASSGVRWVWSPVQLLAGSPVPPGRSDHGLAFVPLGCDSLCDTLYVFGGRGGAGQALGDVWRLVYASRAQNRFRWESVTPAGAGPGPRYGHTAVYDPGPPGGQAAGYPRMLVFGGRDSAGALCDNRVWSLTLRGPHRWSELTPATASPAPRTGHVALMDLRARNPVTKPRRMTVFGGEGASGTLDDTWFLSRGNTSLADTTYAWTALAKTAAPAPAEPQPLFTYNERGERVLGAGVARSRHAPHPWAVHTGALVSPPARTRAAFAFDDVGDRILVWGGDADGGDASTGLLADLWALGPPLDPSFPAVWTPVPQDSAPSPRAGGMMLYWPLGSVTVSTPERFDPAAPAGSRFTRLDWAPLYDQYLYPYMFLTPQGKVLYAAITDSSRFLDPDPLSPTRGWHGAIGSLFSGASGVALRPNLFMKSGGDQQPALTGLLELDSLGQTAGWQPVGGMLPRIDHNTVMLPDGRALVLGGDAQRKNTALAQRQPQIFDPVTRTWSPPLATAPAIRGYHSTAVLLPDARVLTGGGFIADTRRDSAEVYSPPYLFADAAGTPALRPEITAVPETLAYDQAFTLCACQGPALRSMSLIRPGAPTHAFDQNARFVPLGFEPHPTGSAFTVRSPRDANVAPPGDYLLFVVDTAGVPSVGRWVRLRPGAVVPSVPCPSPCVTSAPPAAPALPFALGAPRPNPSAGSVRIEFTLPEAARLTLDVLDVQGRLVRRVAARAFPSGRHALDWDGRGSRGGPLGPGIYFARLEHADGRRLTARMVRLP